MKMQHSPVLESYWKVLKTLSTDWKLALIDRLTQSVRQNLSTEPNSMKLAFGAWKSDETAEEMIQTLQKTRKTDRQIEEL